MVILQLVRVLFLQARELVEDTECRPSEPSWSFFCLKDSTEWLQGLLPTRELVELPEWKLQHMTGEEYFPFQWTAHVVRHE